MRPRPAVLLTLALGACSADPPTQEPDPPQPTQMVAMTPTNQSAAVGTAVASPPTVKVVDANANPVQGVTVSFTIGQGGGSLQNPLDTTNANGFATTAAWTLGPAAGANTVTASAAGLSSVTFTATGTATTGGGGHITADRADDVSGNQIHVVYVLPSDGTDRQLDLNGTLVNSVGAFLNWLSGETGGRTLRLDTYQGAMDITFFRLSRTDAVMQGYGAFVRDTIERELAAAGFNVTTKVYAVYYDGGSTYSCGGGAWPPALQGRVAAMYLKGTPPGASPCPGNTFAGSASSFPGYMEFGMLHEIMHTLGFVHTSAPHHTMSGHTSDSPTDLMYAGSQPWAPTVLDVGKDDYFGNSVPAGVLNLAASPFLTP